MTTNRPTHSVRRGDELISADESVIHDSDDRLHNADLAPVPDTERKWGAFAIFNVWTNDVQSLAGYTLAASLFITAGISGWYVFAAIILAGVVVMFLVNLSGRPSVRYGIPYAVMARTSMGVLGARVPALIRGIVAMFWFGAQTYFASTAVALAINAVVPNGPTGEFLGMNLVDWVAYVVVAGFQVLLFIRGLEGMAKFLNFAGPAVYVVMILLLVAIWVQAGDELIQGVGTLFQGDKGGVSAVLAFFGVVGTMIAYFAAVVVNFGDFSRQTHSVKAMRRGNFYGLPISLTFFTFLALFITAGAYIVYQDGTGEPATNPAEIVGLADNTALTIVAAITFFLATVGINLVANFIPPAYDLANLMPSKITFRGGGLITAAAGFVIGALWVAAIGDMGLPKFVDTLGAILAPLYGILVCDYYILRKQRLHIRQAFTTSPRGIYHFRNGWNVRALVAGGIAAIFSMTTVWLPALEELTGFAWLFGAVLGGLFHWIAMRGRVLIDPVDEPATAQQV
ncbi:NCS1 family nucleobase:cation symporter-1 [Pseudactinotalea sp. HY160]|uniref:NCS1 family nucleobase:cation symporter-1 n=1 Tax=Pseudactinotalea sp. HY160 TaxID=2654490 RepID=UPI00128DE5FA|nr:NCS1 family nucleobase:cation symporter-1 [Pseudactinotalea sp. HY160]MPV51385.1 NCS1 family nucleobase:cation symporter-1 [Pseudactinotalea sp. HY160]